MCRQAGRTQSVGLERCWQIIHREVVSEVGIRAAIANPDKVGTQPNSARMARPAAARQAYGDRESNSHAIEKVQRQYRETS